MSGLVDQHCSSNLTSVPQFTRLYKAACQNMVHNVLGQMTTEVKGYYSKISSFLFFVFLLQNKVFNLLCCSSYDETESFYSLHVYSKQRWRLGNKELAQLWKWADQNPVCQTQTYLFQFYSSVALPAPLRSKPN